jgi:C1A family cysteine protease
MLKAITLNPTASSVYVDSNFQLYSSGIFSAPCTKFANHALTAVGFGSNFFKMRNSWGSWWGENGYIRLARTGDGNGTSCMLRFSSIPL